MWPFTKKKPAEPPPKPKEKTPEEVADLKYSSALRARRPRAMRISKCDWKNGKADFEVTCDNCKHTITTQLEVGNGKYHSVRSTQLVCWQCGAFASIGDMQDALNKTEKQSGGIFDDEEKSND